MSGETGREGREERGGEWGREGRERGEGGEAINKLTCMRYKHIYCCNECEDERIMFTECM